MYTSAICFKKDNYIQKPNSLSACVSKLFLNESRIKKGIKTVNGRRARKRRQGIMKRWHGVVWFGHDHVFCQMDHNTKKNQQFSAANVFIWDIVLFLSMHQQSKTLGFLSPKI
jgi:hypothetical protein